MSVARTAIKVSAILLLSPLVLATAILFVLIVPFGYGIQVFKQLASLWMNRVNRPLFPVVYTYKKPTATKIWEAIKFVFKIILFPLYLWSLGIKAFLSLIYPLASIFDVFHSFKIRSPEYDIQQLDQFINRQALDKVSVREFAIQMPDEVQIYTCEMVSKQVKEELDMPHIIYFCGNGNRFTNYTGQIINHLEKLKAKVIGFDHSGFGNSGCAVQDGRQRHVPTLSFSPLVAEGIAQVERLLANGVPAEQITLYGHSLGGTVATAVAHHFHSQTPAQKIKVFNDRSLAGTTDFAMAALLPKRDGKLEKKYPLTVFQRIRHGIQTFFTYLLKPLIKFISVLADWNIDASSFADLDPKYRDYVVVRGRERNQVITDEVIPYGASIHKLGRINAESKKRQRTSLGDRDPHKYIFKQPDFEDRLVLGPAHCVPLNSLINTQGKRANDRFDDFVGRPMSP